jgi:hypothetical protein
MIENHKDDDATKARKFHSKDSYVTIAGHEYLAGELDHAYRRAEVYRQAGGEVVLHLTKDGKHIEHAENIRDAMCQGCDPPHRVNWFWSEWHHSKGGYGPERCDCLHNSQMVCKPWHQAHHRGPRWTKSRFPK